MTFPKFISKDLIVMTEKFGPSQKMAISPPDLLTKFTVQRVLIVLMIRSGGRIFGSYVFPKELVYLVGNVFVRPFF